jgi:hypothetical protein
MYNRRLLTLFCFTFSLLLLFGFILQQKSPSIEGAWKLVHATFRQNGSSTWEFPGAWPGNDMKIWSKGHFIFVGRFKDDATATDNFGGGTYTMEGNRYVEKIQFHIAPELVGTTAKMLLEIRNDTLIQTWPVGENGQIDKNSYNEEKYVRLD